MVRGSPVSVTQIFLPASVLDPPSCNSGMSVFLFHKPVDDPCQFYRMEQEIRDQREGAECSLYCPSRVERTFRARSSRVKGFCSMCTPGSSTLCCTTISSVYPVM